MSGNLVWPSFAVAQVNTGSSVSGARDFALRNWVAEATESTSCALDRTSVFALEGSEFEVTELYGMDDQGSCVVQSVVPAGAYLEIGSEIPPEQMVRYESAL